MQPKSEVFWNWPTSCNIPINSENDQFSWFNRPLRNSLASWLSLTQSWPNCCWHFLEGWGAEISKIFKQHVRYIQNLIGTLLKSKWTQQRGNDEKKLMNSRTLTLHVRCKTLHIIASRPLKIHIWGLPLLLGSLPSPDIWFSKLLTDQCQYLSNCTASLYLEIRQNRQFHQAGSTLTNLTVIRYNRQICWHSLGLAKFRQICHSRFCVHF